jgi:hypothetical protein
MKITRMQLKQIIGEAIDIGNASTGEIMVFADEGDPSLSEFKPDAPELAAREIIKRLNLTPLEGYSDSLNDPNTEEIWLGAEDYAKMDAEIGGKRHARKWKKERERMDINNLLARATEWAEDAGGDYSADNPGMDMQAIARDLASGAKYSFAQDEWEALIWHFDEDGRGEEDLIDFLADTIAGAQYSENNNDDYPKILGYTHPETGEAVMITVQTNDDMDDILDPLLRQYPNLPYSIDEGRNMKITRSQLKGLILKETRETHIQGIRNKIARLEAELEVQKAALSRIGARSEEAMAGEWGVGDAMEIESRWGDPIRLNMFGVEDKADLLRRQLDALESAEGGSVEDWPRD